MNVSEDRVIEFAGVLYSTGQQRILEAASRLVKSDLGDLLKEITDITGITDRALDVFGYDSEDTLDYAIDLMSQADVIAGQNVKHFDKPLIEAWARRYGKKIPEKLWVDTFTDLPMQGEQLVTMMAKRGLLLLDAHSALADAYGALKLLLQFPIDDVIVRANTPSIVVLAHAHISDNDKVKKAKFRWSPAPNKVWWKSIKETDIDALAAACPFDISIADKALAALLENSN